MEAAVPDIAEMNGAVHPFDDGSFEKVKFDKSTMTFQDTRIQDASSLISVVCDRISTD